MVRMFTGLVEELGVVEQASRESAAGAATLRLVVKAPRVSQDARLGDSIAVNGCCLTVVQNSDGLLAFDAGSETLSRTNLGRLVAGSPINLERSLQVGDRLGGHLVLGHIDGLGTLIKRQDEGKWAQVKHHGEAKWSHFTFRVHGRLARQMASKGSVTVDGVSLTLVDVGTDRFSVALIPHTLDNTTLGRLQIGDLVNIETDVLAKYVERQLQADRPPAQTDGEN